MKKMIAMLVLVLCVGVASTTLVGCSKDTKKEGTTKATDGKTESTEKKTEAEKK